MMRRTKNTCSTFSKFWIIVTKAGKAHFLSFVNDWNNFSQSASSTHWFVGVEFWQARVHHFSEYLNRWRAFMFEIINFAPIKEWWKVSLLNYFSMTNFITLFICLFCPEGIDGGGKWAVDLKDDENFQTYMDRVSVEYTKYFKIMCLELLWGKNRMLRNVLQS